MTRYYLAGPMSGLPQFNLPLFDAAAAELRAAGHEIVSPAELDNETVRAACLRAFDGKSTPETNGGGTWGDFLSRDVKIVSDEVDGIVLLPGWFKSRGARLEVFVGLLTGKRFAEWAPFHSQRMVPVETDHIRTILRSSLP